MKKELREEIVPSAIMLILDMALYAVASTIHPKIKFDIGSGAFPKLLTLIIAVLLLVRIACSVVRILRVKKTAAAEEQEERHLDKKSVLCGCGTIALLGCYVVSFKAAGFIVSSVIYLFLQQLLFAPPERDRKKYLITITAVAVILPAAVYFMFVYGLHVMLPKGILQGILR